MSLEWIIEKIITMVGMLKGSAFRPEKVAFDKDELI
jgi:hypothetical protein